MERISNIKSHPLIIPVMEIIAKAISFVNMILLIRIFSIDEYADYSFMISIILWASVLMDSGINDLVFNKSLLKDKSNLNQLYSSKIYLSMIIIFFLFFYFLFYNPHLTGPAVILSFVIFFSSMTSFLKMFSRGNGIVGADISTIITEPILRLFLLLIVYFSISIISISFWQFFILYLFAGVLAFAYNYSRIALYFKFRLFFGNYSEVYGTILKTLSKTKYYFLYYLMFVGIQRIDIILLEEYSNKSNLAVFSLAITLFQVAFLFFYSLLTFKFLVFYKNNKILFKYLLSGLVLIVIISQLISPFIYRYLFPYEYINGFTVFNYIIISLIPSVFSLYFVLKNNYLGKANINFYILTFMLFTKFSIYFYLKSSNLETYYFVYIIIEILTLLTFIIHNYFNESSSDQ